MRTAINARLVVAVAATLSISGVVDAWSTGAGTCSVGSDGPAFPSGSKHDGYGKGSLGSGKQDGLYRVVLGDQVLDEDGVLGGAMGGWTDLPLYVRRNDEEAAFKGFLFTLQATGGLGNEEDVSGSFKAEQDTDPVQILESDGDGTPGGYGVPAVCAADVSGATHTSADLKDNAKLTMSVGADKGLVNLTVTVMESATAWYSSTFVLNTEGSGVKANTSSTAPTTSSTAPPTSSTVTPTSSTATPTSSAATPTPAPSVPGNETGTAAPTAAPSGAPPVSGGALSALAAAASALALTWVIA